MSSKGQLRQNRRRRREVVFGDGRSNAMTPNSHSFDRNDLS
jgi:hypothetical protein